MRFVNFVSAAVLLVVSTPALAGDWPAFRGPHGNGICDEKNLPVEWSTEKNVKWKIELPAPGNSSPIVVGDSVFIASATKEGDQRSLHCLDRADGTQRWVQSVKFDADRPTHKTNPFGSSTPVSDGQRVIVWHFSAGLYCYDMKGKQIWKRDLGDFRHMWGYGSSPILHNDRVILYCGPGKRVFITAIDLDNGKTLWETDEPQSGNGERNEDGKYMGSWSTPVIATIERKKQIVATMPTRVNGYDPDNGKILWSCDGIRGERGDLAYSSPLISKGFCVAVGGYQGPSIGFPIGGNGNITENRAWRVKKNPQNIGSGVFLGNYIFRPNAGPGTIECIEASTGRVVWTDRAAGANHWGSIIAADGNLYVTNQKGTTVVFKPNHEKFELVAKNQLDEPSNSTPAISDGQIFVRTMQHLYCIEKS